MIPHSRPTLGREELDAVRTVIQTAQVGGGETVERFEDEIQRYTGTRYAVAVQSGSAALHLALLALNVRRGDEVILPTYCCSAVLNTVMYLNARPVLVDVLPRSGNIDPAAVKKALSRRVKAVIVPHMFGMPAEIRAIRKLGVPVVEDCAMAIGGRIGKTMLGAWGDVSIFSFYATKVMTTGSGGAVATSRRDLWTRMLDGVNYDNRDDYAVRYNYRMNAVAAAMGRAQLKKLSRWIKRRGQIAEVYSGRLKVSPDALPPRAEGRIFYRYVMDMRSQADRLMEWMGDHGVECKRPVYRPLHRYFPKLRHTCPEADRIHRGSVSLPIYPTLTDGDARRIVGLVNDFSGRG